MTAQPASPQGPRAFQSTAWSVIRRAKTDETEGRLQAVEELANLYWAPIYWTLRCKWKADPEEARDLTQDYFLMLIERNVLETVDSSRGRFRAFVKASLKNFFLQHRRSGRALKRGGQHRITALDHLDEVESDRPKNLDQPEKIFDRTLLRNLIRQALAHLAKNCQREGNSMHFELFEQYYLAESAGRKVRYEDLREQFDLGSHDVKNRLTEMRLKFRKEVLRLLSDGVTSQEELMNEMRELFQP